MSATGYEELRDRLATAIESAASAQASGRRSDIDTGFDDLDGAIPRSSDPRFDKLLIALAFWEGWCDSAEHDWYYYEPLSEKDWPVLAADVVADLRADREIQNEAVLEQFDWRRRKPSPFAWAWLKKVLRG